MNKLFLFKKVIHEIYSKYGNNKMKKIQNKILNLIILSMSITTVTCSSHNNSNNKDKLSVNYTSKYEKKYEN